MPNNREFVAVALRNARENCGLSQQTAADQVGLSRTVLAQIELGNRRVSPDELSKLAALYRRTLADFSGGADQSSDEVLATVFKGAPWLNDRHVKPRLQTVLGLCRQATVLEQSLGRAPRTGPPHYDVQPPRNLADAIVQGEQVATQERQRLGLGSGSPVATVSSLLGSQGVRIAAIQFPEEVTGLFIRDRIVGAVIIANSQEPAFQSFGFLHGYAHALFERDRTVVITTPLSSDELSEVRADAFAAAFLLPRAGIETAIADLDKGRPSRKAHTVFGVAADDPIEAEVRSAPGSQTLTFHDLTSIARKFGASYEAAVYRFRALDVISKPETKHLLNAERRRAAAAYSALFSSNAENEKRVALASAADLELKCEIVHLAIEAYRRQLIDKAALIAFVPKLQTAGLTEAKLLELAEAAR